MNNLIDLFTKLLLTAHEDMYPCEYYDLFEERDLLRMKEKCDGECDKCTKNFLTQIAKKC